MVKRGLFLKTGSGALSGVASLFKFRNSLERRIDEHLRNYAPPSEG